jgi:hypothetical protein
VRLLAESDAAVDSCCGDLVDLAVVDQRPRFHQYESFIDGAVGLDADDAHRLSDYVERIDRARFVSGGHAYSSAHRPFLVAVGLPRRRILDGDLDTDRARPEPSCTRGMFRQVEARWANRAFVRRATNDHLPHGLFVGVCLRIADPVMPIPNGARSRRLSGRAEECRDRCIGELGVAGRSVDMADRAFDRSSECVLVPPWTSLQP